MKRLWWILLLAGCAEPTAPPCVDINDPRVEWTGYEMETPGDTMWVGTCGPVAVR